MSEPDPLAEIRDMIEVARKAFRARARSVLFEAYQQADAFSSAIGEVSADQAFDAWAERVAELLKASPPTT